MGEKKDTSASKAGKRSGKNGVDIGRLKMRTISNMDKIGSKLDDIGVAMEALEKGLEAKARHDYEQTIAKIDALRAMLKDNPVVDLKAIGGVLKELNKGIRSKLPKKGKARTKHIFNIDRAFSDTHDALGEVMDREVSAGLRELKARTITLFRERTSMMRTINTRSKKRIMSVRGSLTTIGSKLPSLGKKDARRVAEKVEEVLKDLSTVTIGAIRTRRKDFKALERRIKDSKKALKRTVKRLGREKVMVKKKGPKGDRSRKT